MFLIRYSISFTISLLWSFFQNKIYQRERIRCFWLDPVIKHINIVASQEAVVFLYAGFLSDLLSVKSSEQVK